VRERVTPINYSTPINAIKARPHLTAPALAWPWCNASSAEKEEQDLSNGDNLGANSYTQKPAAVSRDLAEMGRLNEANPNARVADHVEKSAGDDDTI
jgi:hypothetical protein